MTESFRLADQIRRAFEGNAWHGDSVLELLADVSANTAAAQPIKDAHSIWEILLHIRTWDDVTCRRIAGDALEPTDEQNFPAVKDASEAAWRQAIDSTKKTHNELIQAVARFPDARLAEQVPGKSENYHNFYYLISGIVQHEIYHAGQIALLKKAAR